MVYERLPATLHRHSAVSGSADGMGLTLFSTRLSCICLLATCRTINHEATPLHRQLAALRAAPLRLITPWRALSVEPVESILRCASGDADCAALCDNTAMVRFGVFGHDVVHSFITPLAPGQQREVHIALPHPRSAWTVVKAQAAIRRFCHAVRQESDLAAFGERRQRRVRFVFRQTPEPQSAPLQASALPFLRKCDVGWFPDMCAWSCEIGAEILQEEWEDDWMPGVKFEM